MAPLLTRFVRNVRLPMLLAFSVFIHACGPQATEDPASAQDPSRAATPTQDANAKVGTDIKVQLPEGDLERGELLALRLGCISCHVNAPDMPRFDAGDGLPSVLERGVLRMEDPAYAGSAATNEEYLIESILVPGAYAVQGPWRDDAMPPTFGDRMTAQNLADILAWLRTFE